MRVLCGRSKFTPRGFIPIGNQPPVFLATFMPFSKETKKERSISRQVRPVGRGWVKPGLGWLETWLRVSQSGLDWVGARS